MLQNTLPYSLSISPEEKQRMARQRIEDVEQMMDLDLEGELEEVGVADLGYGVNAVTIPTLKGSKIVFDSSSFFRKDYEEQVDIAAEEGIHVKQQNNSFDDWLIENYGAQELAENVGGYRSRSDFEGEAELVLENILPYHKTTYPYDRWKKETELERKGVDVESELTSEIDDFTKELLEDYTEVYESFETGNLYIEHGEVAGDEYLAVVAGDVEYGKEVINAYLESLGEVDGSVEMETEENISGYLEGCC